MQTQDRSTGTEEEIKRGRKERRKLRKKEGERGGMNSDLWDAC